MAVDLSVLSGTDFALGAFGATLVELYRLKRLLDKNDGKVKASRFQWFLNTVWFFCFIAGGGILAATQGVSPELSALYAGFTLPVFLSVILKDNAEAEKKIVVNAIGKRDAEISELKKHMRMFLSQFGDSIDPELAQKIEASVELKPRLRYNIDPDDPSFDEWFEDLSQQSRSHSRNTSSSHPRNTNGYSDSPQSVNGLGCLLPYILLIAVIGLVIYFDLYWLILLLPFLWYIFSRIRHSVRFQKFLSALV